MMASSSSPAVVLHLPNNKNGRKNKKSTTTTTTVEKYLRFIIFLNVTLMVVVCYYTFWHNDFGGGGITGSISSSREEDEDHKKTISSASRFLEEQLVAFKSAAANNKNNHNNKKKNKNQNGKSSQQLTLPLQEEEEEEDEGVLVEMKMMEENEFYNNKLRSSSSSSSSTIQKKPIPGGGDGKDDDCAKPTTPGATSISSTKFEHVSSMLKRSKLELLKPTTTTTNNNNHNGLEGVLLQKEGNNNFGKYEPIYCPTLQETLTWKEKVTTDPNIGSLEHIKLTRHGDPTIPQFWISLNGPRFDKARWSIMEYGKYYEQDLIQLFADVLRQFTHNVRVLDVGSNVGYFSILSSAIHNTIHIDAFEPNLQNILRFCESLQLNQWCNEYDTNCPSDYLQTINIYNMGIGKETGYYEFTVHANPGAGTLGHKVADVADNNNMNVNANAKNANVMQVITLDDFAESRGWLTTPSSSSSSPPPEIAILKIDVEGKEWLVVEGAINLLQSHIVKNIFMEATSKSIENKEDMKKVMIIVNSGYRLKMYGGFSGPKFLYNGLHDEVSLVTFLNNKCQKLGPTKQINMWFVLN